MTDSERLARALEAIDAANADDPQRLRVRGELRPKELAHAQLVSEWVAELCERPSDALLIAARAHHIRRWEIPREAYPAGRSGYLRWRKALQTLHADQTGSILARLGFEDETIDRVRDLLRKKGLGRDPEVQVLEDALCLVFLETQLHDLSERLDGEKLADVARKTLAKMSDRAIAAARELPLGPGGVEILERASRGSIGRD